MLKSSYQEYYIEAGCDEAGRGCLAGPVFAAAVIFSKNFTNNSINDSKKLNKKQRDELRIVIENESIAWAVSKVDANEIDEINILQASMLAMTRAVQALSIRPDWVWVDGNHFPKGLVAAQYTGGAMIKGDAKESAISAASILAKVARDTDCLRLDALYPEYGFAQHKGYPTAAHLKALQQHGATPEHRMSFAPVQTLQFKTKK